MLNLRKKVMSQEESDKEKFAPYIQRKRNECVGKIAKVVSLRKGSAYFKVLLSGKELYVKKSQHSLPIAINESVEIIDFQLGTYIAKACNF